MAQSNTFKSVAARRVNEGWTKISFRDPEA